MKMLCYSILAAIKQKQQQQQQNDVTCMHK